MASWSKARRSITTSLSLSSATRITGSDRATINDMPVRLKGRHQHVEQGNLPEDVRKRDWGQYPIPGFRTRRPFVANLQNCFPFRRFVAIAISMFKKILFPMVAVLMGMAWAS